MPSCFRDELEKLLSSHNVDDTYSTPAYILAEYMIDCLSVWSRANTSMLTHRNGFADLTNVGAQHRGKWLDLFRAMKVKGMSQ